MEKKLHIKPNEIRYIEPEPLKNRYEFIVAEYIAAFINKQDIDFDNWIGGDVGEVAVFGDYFFNFDDIRRDVDENAEKHLILEWYNENMEFNVGKSHDHHYWINYSSYLKGFRRGDKE